MSSNTLPVILPPLTKREIGIRDVKELALNGELSDCRDEDDGFDNQRALDLLRAYVIEIFVLHLEARFNSSGYHPHWVPTIMEESIRRVLRCLRNHPTLNSELCASLLSHTLVSHLRSTRTLHSADFDRLFGPSAPPAPFSLTTVSDEISKGKSSVLKSGGARPMERKNLFDEYRSRFPEPGILDICWAAHQHYREWARWLKGELKDGSKPDRLFRQVLTSGKDVRKLRREPRPKNWK